MNTQEKNVFDVGSPYKWSTPPFFRSRLTISVLFFRGPRKSINTDSAIMPWDKLPVKVLRTGCDNQQQSDVERSEAVMCFLCNHRPSRLVGSRLLRKMSISMTPWRDRWDVGKSGVRLEKESGDGGRVEMCSREAP